MAPESALTDLRLRQAPTGSPETGGGTGIRERDALERALLVAWAKEKGLVLPAEEYLSRKEDTHGEHHVYWDVAREKYFKITHGVELDRAGFALTVGTISRIGKKSQNNISVPHLREATPFEYLARLQLFNRTFQDSIELEGVFVEPGKEAIVTSQPFINGRIATEEEVKRFMTESGFAVLPDIRRGKQNSVSYFRQSDGIAVFDTHGQNFLVSGSEIMPIDALIIAVSEEMEAFLSMTEDERIAEIGRY